MSWLVIPFYYGLGSRYSYLAATQLDRIEKSADVRFEWLPLQSGELIRRANNGRSPFNVGQSSGQYDWGYRRRDAEAWAALYGIPYREPAPFELNPADLAKACWSAEVHGLLKPISRRMFQAIFVEGLTMSRFVLGRLTSEVGLDGADLEASLNTPQIEARHEEALNRALDDGAFGVPSFVVAGQIFWGNDRLPLVENAIAKARCVERLSSTVEPGAG